MKQEGEFFDEHGSGASGLQLVRKLGQSTLVVNHTDLSHIEPNILVVLGSLRSFVVCKHDKMIRGDQSTSKFGCVFFKSHVII